MDDGWTIVELPDRKLSNEGKMKRCLHIAKWAKKCEIPPSNIGISSNIVRFKHSHDATLFKLMRV